MNPLRTDRLCVMFVALAMAAGLPGICLAEGGIALLAPQAHREKMSPEAAAAWELAAGRHKATLLLPGGDGKFVDRDGNLESLDSFAVVWHHQGDSNIQSGPIYDAKTVEALRKYVAGGRGLYLSGAALAMVQTLDVEPVAPRLGPSGNDSSQAMLAPLVKGHPIFRELRFAGNQVFLSDAGHPAYADFHGTPGPGKGMLLARTGGSENALVEYEVGSGRLIAMGWRLPHYSHANNAHRHNLERVTANILDYLGDRKQWQKVVVRPVQIAGPGPSQPGNVTEHRRQSLRLAIEDLMATYGDDYSGGARYLARLEQLPTADDPQTIERFEQLKREALLANPLLDFDELLVVKRSMKTREFGLPANWEGNSSLAKTGYDNEIARLSPIGPEGKLTTLWRPENGSFVGDVDLNFAADKLLFSLGSGSNGRWQVCEIDADGTSLRELPLILEPDVDNYDACYLPDGDVLFTSTAPFTGVPCVKGSSHVANIYRLQRASGKIRRLTFDQDHNWCPAVLPDGRVLYLRWEYSDIPHFVSRILFQMNPDGTDQREYYGSNSYWPNSMFYARAIPGRRNKFVAVIVGHHDVRRRGELVLFDTSRGRHEAQGAVQRIPGRGRAVEPIILDGLSGRSWPKFLHPFPLSEKHFLTAMRPNGGALWGIYLVDVFDNLLLLKEEPGYVLFEPIPLSSTRRPPVVPVKVRPERRDAVLYLADVYQGPGLAGVPRGTVKRLRLLSYQFGYHGMGGQVNRVGLDGPWDVKRILGTVPVESDGSASFRVPANTPISMQPLDEEGKAIALMRSWTTAMPGEVQSCVGCHQPQNSGPPSRQTIAAGRTPSEIEPWYGPARGFSFVHEVQPVLDRYCTGCHNGKPGDDGAAPIDLTAREPVHPRAASGSYNNGTQFTPSYMALRSYVRSPTIESDMHLLPPYEFHADTTKLVQMLRRGHYNVRLDAEALDRLITWIDLHTPAHGTWREIVGDRAVNHQRDRRREMMRLYANLDEDPETLPETPQEPIEPIIPPPLAEVPQQEISCRGWPFDAAEAQRRQAAEPTAERTLELDDGVAMELVRIPPGEFVIGGGRAAGQRPRTIVKIEKSFWMGRFEVTNRQFARFDPGHDSRLEHGDFLQFGVRERGYPLNGPDQPVCRVSWQRATAFCRWLSEKAGARVALPTEAQWEYACRAGTATPLWYGEESADFAPFANLADLSLRRVDKFGWGLPVGAVPPWRPAIESVDDKHRVSAPVGRFQPNPWGLYDVHGNAAEWTRSLYRPYPYDAGDGREDLQAPGRRVVRGGSWYDRPQRGRSADRQAYHPWQGVFDVGFRVVVEQP